MRDVRNFSIMIEEGTTKIDDAVVLAMVPTLNFTIINTGMNMCTRRDEQNSLYNP